MALWIDWCLHDSSPYILISHSRRDCVFTWVWFCFPNLINDFMPEKNLVFFSSCTSLWRTYLKYRGLYFTAPPIRVSCRLVTRTCVCVLTAAQLLRGLERESVSNWQNKQMCVGFTRAKEGGTPQWSKWAPLSCSVGLSFIRKDLVLQAKFSAPAWTFASFSSWCLTMFNFLL